MSNPATEFQFQQAEKLGESLASSVFLAREKNNKKQYLLKKIHPELLIGGVADHLRQQLNHLKQLAIPELFIPELHVDESHNLQLIMPFPDGQLLSAWLTQKPGSSIKTVLEIGIAIADCLATRHKAALIHQAIKPNNILILENPIRIRLLDELQIVSTAQLSQFINNKHYQRQALPYAAPEMTGRIRTHVNYSSDLYSLGIVLYECITGKPPFLSTDSLSIIHSHLAELPKPAIDLNPNCPLILSDIVAMLLLKQPEKRYQSAMGLRADLKICLDNLKSAGSNSEQAIAPTFLLRQHEIHHQISIPSILVGREQEQQQLLDAYQHICSGQFAMVMVSGLSGIGKTRLIQELELPIIAKQGYFSYGKFNQFSTHSPYGTLVNAFNHLIRQILTEDANRISYWRSRMLEALDIYGQLVIDLIPELEKIIGKQPEVPPLPANDARIRFNTTFSRFFGCVGCKAHPFVLFIDDMQWCDQATFDLLEFVGTQCEDQPYLLLIVAYRSNEVDKQHRIFQLESIVAKSTQHVIKLELLPLYEIDVNQMVAYILNSYTSRTEELSATLFSILGGNPLYISESLRWMHNQNYLQISTKGIWSWDRRSTLEMNMPSNATTLFVEKLSDFPPPVRDLLATAALLGTQYSSADLADISQISVADLYLQFSEVFEKRILHIDNDRMFFAHDQIQLAAAQYLDLNQEKLRHQLIAQAFIKKTEDQHSSGQQDNELLFSIVDHLYAGRGENDSEAQRFSEAQFNYRAGIAAMENLALEASNHYLSQSAELCDNSLWDSQYEFMLALHQNLARATFNSGEQYRTQEIVQRCLPFLRSDSDQATMLFEHIMAVTALGDLSESIQLSHRALSLLQLALPTATEDIQREIKQSETRLHHSDADIWSDILLQSPLENANDLLIDAVYVELMGIYFFTGNKLMVRLMSLKAVEYSLDKGLGSFSCYALACMAYVTLADRRYALMEKYEQATLALAKLQPNTPGVVRTMLVLEWSTLYLQYSIAEMKRYSDDTAMEGNRCGELRFGGLALCAKYFFSFLQGDNIPLLDSQLAESKLHFLQYNIGLPAALIKALQFSLRPLLTDQVSATDTAELTAELELWNNTGFAAALAWYYITSGAVAYFCHDYAKAERLLKLADPYIDAVFETFFETIWLLFRSLVQQKKGVPFATQSCYQRLSDFSSKGPLLKPYMALLKAEGIATEGDFREARIHYLDAIDSANKEHYILLSAFLNDSLCQHLEKESHYSSEFHRQQANQLYQQCGVINRVQKPTQGTSSFLMHNTISILQASPVKTTVPLDEELDIRFLFDAVKAISSELNLDALMSMILKSVMAKLGAQTGFLLIAKDDQLVLQLKSIKQDSVSVFSQQDPEFNSDKLSMAIASYAFNTQQKVILSNAMMDGDFTTNNVVREQQLISVLCIPIVMQTKTLGVLYFENSLIESVFTETQIIHADLLISQAAIALQNSNLMHDTLKVQEAIEEMNANLETQVAERSRELQKKQLQLTHANRLSSLGELATGIAHELGQPLQIIQSASRIIQDEANCVTIEKDNIIRFSDDINEQITRATNIINNMRTFARNDDGNLPKNLDPAVPFRQCLLFCSEQFYNTQIELKIEIAENLPVVLMNAQKFQQIVINLLSNARHAVEQQLKQHAEQYQKQVIARLYQSTDRQTVILEIEDNGIGMDNEGRQKCLNPFYTTKEAGNGTGLGLSIVHDLIGEFNFMLQIESEPNKGSLFTVILPANITSPA